MEGESVYEQDGKGTWNPVGQLQEQKWGGVFVWTDETNGVEYLCGQMKQN